MSKPDHQTQTAVRLPDPLLARIDKLAERMSAPGMPVTRADLIRGAIHLGIDLLEKRPKR